jgi:hypothetical protein
MGAYAAPSAQTGSWCVNDFVELTQPDWSLSENIKKAHRPIAMRTEIDTFDNDTKPAATTPSRKSSATLC